MRLEVRYDAGDGPSLVGTLLAAERRVWFQYDAAFRARGLELSPFRLPVAEEAPVEAPDRTWQGLHGLFNDSLPDGWGWLLMDRAMRARGVNPAQLTPLDRLAWIGRDGMGALTYHPAADRGEPGPLPLDLPAIAAQSRRILEGSTEVILPALLLGGGSPMGARPKVVAGVSHDFQRVITGTQELPAGYRPWLIKFAAPDDPPDAGPIEAAYADMARAAGITVPATHLFSVGRSRRAFGVERFDRDPMAPARRVHVHTMSGLLHADHRVPGQDYADLLRLTQVLTRDHRDVMEAFRRLVFNVLAHNRDDHTKNVAFMMSPDGTWRLAPAFDVTFSEGPGGEHTMSVNGEGRRPTRAHVLALADQAGLRARESRQVLAQVADAVAQWSALARARRVSAASARRIEAHLAEVRDAFGPRPR